MSILLQTGAKRLTIVALLNRMGDKTKNFVHRIRTLRTGNDPERDTDAAFQFVTLYDLADFDSDDLSRGLQHVENLIKDFQQQTRHAGFRSLAEQELRYFRPIPVLGHTFESGRPSALPEAVRVSFNEADEPTELSASTDEGRSFAIAARAVRSRDYGELIQLIEQYDERAQIYRVVSLLVASISYLRSAGQFSELRETLITQIERSQKERLEGESDLSQEELVGRIRIETHCLFALSLIAYLDIEGAGRYDYVARLVIGDGWNDRPKNRAAYFSHPRVPWSVSFSLHQTQKPHHPDSANDAQ